MLTVLTAAGCTLPWCQQHCADDCADVSCQQLGPQLCGPHGWLPAGAAWPGTRGGCTVPPHSNIPGTWYASYMQNIKHHGLDLLLRICPYSQMWCSTVVRGNEQFAQVCGTFLCQWLAGAKRFYQVCASSGTTSADLLVAGCALVADDPCWRCVLLSSPGFECTMLLHYVLD